MSKYTKFNKYSPTILNYLHSKLNLPYNQEMMLIDEEIKKLNKVSESKKVEYKQVSIDYMVNNFMKKYKKNII